MTNSLQNIDINRSDNFSITEMINSVYEFYSNDLRISNQSYPGFQNLLKITGNKIEELISNGLPNICHQLISELESQIDQVKIESELEKQFPNYAFSIILKQKELDELIVINCIKIRISLLSNFFTVFHEETVIHKGISAVRGMSSPVVTRLVSSQSSIIDKGNLYLEKIIKITESVFPKHEFIGHSFLFNVKLRNGTPLGVERQSDEEEFPIYNFLFDFDYLNFQSFYVAP